MSAVVCYRLTGEREKAGTLAALVRGEGPQGATYIVELHRLSALPGTPIAYWVTDRVLHAFSAYEPFETTGSGRFARQGGVTGDDFRYVRVWWENGTAAAFSRLPKWVPLAKGGRARPFYDDIESVVAWDPGRETYWAFAGLPHRPSLKPASQPFYFRAGITWPLRGSRFTAQSVPAGCAFSVAGKMAFAEHEDLPAVLALFNSSAFDAFIMLFAGKVGGVQYEAGLIQRIPVPPLEEHLRNRLGACGRDGWSCQRSLDTRFETSHAFTLPALLQATGESLMERAARWLARVAEAEERLSAIQRTIDDLCFALYGIAEDDRKRIEEGVSSSLDTNDTDSQTDDEADVSEFDPAPMIGSLVSWTVGASFGRFDVRLAIGSRDLDPEPGPFDALPQCSPGMLTGREGLAVDAPPTGYPVDFPRDGVLVDDQGHENDVIARARQVFQVVFGDGADARWREAAEILDSRGRDLRAWFARTFFEDHIKRYSKSRRKAPIYWQLATSTSYSVWLYYHRFTRDTLYRVVNDYVMPKLKHEERKLTSLIQDAGPSPSAGQRTEIDAQERFVDELRGLREEVARVAPLWNADLNDGVIINFAPLWRLVPQNRSWQKECKAVWDKLVAAEYDWAHLAMHLWPERVVPKCVVDRSLAIAHGLQEVFWEEDAEGKWKPKEVAKEVIDRLIGERTSAAVKAALDDLLRAPAPTAPSGGGRRSGGRRAQANGGMVAASGSRGKASAAESSVDEATVAAVRDAIAAADGGASKAEVMEVTGMSSSDWNAAINALLGQGAVIKTGAARGTRYQLAAEEETA
jgi:hypothetical protein